MYHADFESRGGFHVRAAMIDASGDRQQAVMDFFRLYIILRLAGNEQLVQQFGGEAAIAHQRAINVKHGVQQIFVMAGQNLQLGLFAAQDRDFDIPAPHVADAILGRDDAGLGGYFELGVDVVGRLGVVGILKQNALQTGGFINRLVAILRRAILIAEAQPAM